MFYTYYKQRGNNILLRAKNPNDTKTKQTVVKGYSPVLYTETNQESEFKNIYGKNLKPINFDKIFQAKSFADEYKDVEGMDISGNSDYANQFIIDVFEGQQPDYQPENIRIGMLDIEVDAPEFPKPEEAKWPINQIDIYDSVEDKHYFFNLIHDDEMPRWSKKNCDEDVKDLTIVPHFFDNEKDLLIAFMNHWREHAYDISSGWNSEQFDMPYIVNRCFDVVGEKTTIEQLSPFNQIDFKEVKNDWGNPTQKVDIVGVPHLDYMALYKKHTFTPRESFKLDFIANAELNKGKVSYEESKSLHNLYRENPQKFCDYNIIDTDLIRQLDDKLGLFSLTYAMAYYTLSNFEDTLGTVNIWEKLVAKFLYNKNIIPPFRKKAVEHREFEGAFVKEPIPGFNEWIIAFDLNSLYPHIEMQYNIGPDTHIPTDELPDELLEIREKYTFDDLLNQKADLSALKKYKVSMTANFEFYRTDKMSFFSEIKREIYGDRKGFKGKMLQAERDKNDAKAETEIAKYDRIESRMNNMQMGLKILLNGGYGALANKHFLYYMVENAEAITMSGQLVNKWTSIKVEKKLQEMFETNEKLWVAGDTDSGYYKIAHFMNSVDETDIQKKVDIADRFGEEVMQPYIDSVCVDLCDYMNGYEQKMNWSREVIADKAIWVAKKKYVMSVLDNEGVRYKKEPKIKLTGLEAVKSSTPEWSRKLLKECYILALNKTEEDLQQRVKSIYDEFVEFDSHTIAIPRGVNNIEKWYDPDRLFIKGTPQNVKAAIVHNYMVDKLELKHIGKIVSGSKIKFIELKMPNPTGYPIVAFDTYLPEEFKLEKYVDRDTIFEKAFIKPLEIFLDAISWDHEEKITLF